MMAASPTSPYRPLTQATSEYLSTRRPSIPPPYGLDTDIKHIIRSHKTFKERKSEEQKVMISTIPPRLPMETNVTTLFKSTSKKDYPPYELPEKKSAVSIARIQRETVNRLSLKNPETIEEISKPSGIIFYSANDAERDKMIIENNKVRYNEFVKKKASEKIESKHKRDWR